jgi:2-polyprenyl-3-methyl-5-hydroxy-6-metoxy-1,4-benzoquinol methylase
MDNYTEYIHNQSWQNTKSEYSFYKTETRFEILKSIIISENPSMVLDVGCGSGYLSYILKQENPNIYVHGFDISDEALRQASTLDKKYKLDINKKVIPEDANNYDMVICSEVLEHLVDIRNCLCEIRRVLKNTGKLVITVPNFSFWKFRIDSLLGRIPYVVTDERHLQTFNVKSLTEIMDKSGFDILRLEGIRTRFQSLLNISVSLFSETLIVKACKK